MKQINSKLENMILWGAGLVSVVTTPFISYEPINLPRLVVLTTFGIILIFLISIHRRNLIHKGHKFYWHLLFGV
jgi:hypothetical protein